MSQVIKGTAYVARRALLEKNYGADRAAEMLKAIAADVPLFEKPVLATSMLPVADWLQWNDVLVRRFFSDHANPYFWLGEQSAEWALTEGPYRSLTVDRNLAQFLERGPALYRSYYEIGEFHLAYTPGRVEIRIDGIPVQFHHPHFEHNPAGYVKRAVELVGQRRVSAKQVAGFSRGQSYIQYVYTFREEGGDGPTSLRS